MQLHPQTADKAASSCPGPSDDGDVSGWPTPCSEPLLPLRPRLGRPWVSGCPSLGLSFFLSEMEGLSRAKSPELLACSQQFRDSSCDL